MKALLLAALAASLGSPALESAGVEVNRQDRVLGSCQFDTVVTVVSIDEGSPNAACVAVPSQQARLRVTAYTRQLEAAGWMRPTAANSIFVRSDQPEDCRDLLRFDTPDGALTGLDESEQLFVFRITRAANCA